MRSAVDALLKWHRTINSPDLPAKLDKLAASPFGFFRGTFFLFADDIRNGPFSKWETLDDHGLVVGDLHTENYGSYRAVTGEITYDINDFDESTEGRYVFDTARLAVSLILASIENGHRMGDAINIVDTAVHSWVGSLARFRKLKRNDFAKLPDTAEMKAFLADAAERSRPEFMKTLAEESVPGSFVFKVSQNYVPLQEHEREEVGKALPAFLANCLAPANANPRKYRFLDAATRVAGTGSLGRKRFAVLLGKGGKNDESFATLRLVEWKQALDSALDSRKPRASSSRNETVFQAAATCQLFPKRYLGHTVFDGLEMQGREIGANDTRFNHKVFKDLARFQKAAFSFGEILARSHLLGAPGKHGPRRIPQQLAGGEDKFVRQVAHFAMNYAAQAQEDHAELLERRSEVAEKWNKQSSPAHPLRHFSPSS